jgi:predicted amidophosphoribosyltransferase
MTLMAEEPMSMPRMLTSFLKNDEKNELNEDITLLYSTITAMSLLKTITTTFSEALFPLPEAEREVLAMGAVAAFKDLPRAERSPVPEACSIFSYKDDRVWRLIWSIKYKKSAGGTAIAGYALHQVLRSYLAAMTGDAVIGDAAVMPQIIVVPMPITARRRRERGFNQCELLAEEIERLEIERLKIENRLIIAKDLLVRKIHKSRQTLKDRAERLESARDIFAVNEEAAGQIKNSAHLNNGTLIIVIDDVITTGGTIRDAVETLRKAGFENTWGLSVAH